MFKDKSAKKPHEFKRVKSLMIGLLVSLAPQFIQTAVVYSSAGAPQPLPQTRRPVRRTPGQPLRIDYSKFSHVTHVTTQKLACDSCHKFPTKNWNEVRKGAAAFPDVADFPEHSTCLNCHRRQFFARERPAPLICSNCHTGVTPFNTARFRFPSLGDIPEGQSKRREFISDFQINFPHDKHLDVVSFNNPSRKTSLGTEFVSIAWQEKKETVTEPTSCPVCHQTYQPQGKSDEEYVTKPPKNLDDAFWLKKGTFKTIPNSHTTCFSCHNQDLGISPSPSDCNACHKVKQTQAVLVADFDPKVAERMLVTDETMLRAWGRRISSGTYRHEGGDHPSVGCLGCHAAQAMNTLEPKTLKVAVKSCGGADGCHITATTDDGGILNYEIDQKKTKPTSECSKCHVNYGKQSVPLSHVEAIPTKK